MNPTKRVPEGFGQKPCGGCKRQLPGDCLGPMLLLPIPILKNLGFDLEGEAKRLYCRRCQWSQSIFAIVLCLIALTAVVSVVLQKLGMLKS